MSAPRVAVIIPTRNRPALLPRAVRSALRTGIAEVVVVDDGSDPPVDLSGVADPRLRVVRQPPSTRGVCASRNRGMAESTASHLVFLDDDDRLAPLAGRWYRRMAKACGSDRIAVGAVVVEAPGRWPQLRRPPSSRRGEIWGLDRHLLAGGRDFATKQAALVPRGLIEAVGGWDEELLSRTASELFFRLTARADVEGHRWPVYCLNRGSHDRITADPALRERSAAYLRGKHAALLGDPDRRAAFEASHAEVAQRLAAGRSG